MSDFNKLHGKHLIALPGARQTRTFFVMKEVKDSAPTAVLGHLSRADTGGFEAAIRINCSG
ncbi:hypothetical protein [Aliiroseovarius sp. xm-m-378]|uniref:hypothetical protein n=1 Tax=unclassified Aliiroseovarius TaxID=2623558 RepID=UPI0020C2D675